MTKKPRGRPSDARRIAEAEAAAAVDVVEQMQRTAAVVFRRIEELVSQGKDVPLSLLGAARMCAEWHTDYLTVLNALPPDVEKP